MTNNREAVLSVFRVYNRGALLRMVANGALAKLGPIAAFRKFVLDRKPQILEVFKQEATTSWAECVKITRLPEREVEECFWEAMDLETAKLVAEYMEARC